MRRGCTRPACKLPVACRLGARVRGLFSNAGVRDLWERRNDRFAPAFVEHVDRLAADPPASLLD